MITLTPAEYQATVAKIAAINSRARKRGFTGRLEVEAERVVRRNAGDPLPFPGLPIGAEVVQYEATISGTAPRYEGWEFMAALDSLTTADGEAEWVVRCAPGVTDESVDRGALRAGACDHCTTCRPNRRKLYLVRNVDTGEHRQVGATCVKDFLGWQAMPVFISPRDLDDELALGGCSRTPAFTPRFVVVVALATVAAFGWVPRSRAQYDPKAVATASMMTPYLIGPAAGRAGDEDREVIARIQPHIMDAEARADEVIATVLGEFAEAASGYEANLRAALRAEYIELGQLGLLASIVPAYDRIVGRQAERQAQRDAFEPEYLGDVGDKVEISGVITTAMTIDGYAYGTTQRLVVIRTETALVKFCSSAAWTYDVDAGDQVTITATIKRLDVWRERKQTVVVRPKLVVRTPAQAIAS